MKLKIKAAHVGIVLLGLMLSTSFTYVILQKIYYNPSQQKVELPTINVINYKLSIDQQNVLLSDGKTILTYRYNDITCGYCLQQKQYLEQLATSSKLSDQLFLEILISDIETPTLTLTSYYGQQELTNATNDQIFSGLCQLLINKPIECALQQINTNST